MSGFTPEIQRALEQDGEKLRQLTGQDHGPVFIHDEQPDPFAIERPATPQETASLQERLDGVDKVQPPAVPQVTNDNYTASKVAQLIEELGDRASREMGDAYRHRAAFLWVLTSACTSINYLYRALGELKPEDYARNQPLVENLLESTNALKTRLETICAPDKQLAE